MRLTAEIRYAAGPDAVFAMLADEDFVHRKCRATGALEHTAAVERHDDGGVTVTTQRTMPTDDVPDFVRTFVGDRLQVRQVDVWEAPADDGTRAGTTVVEISGAPVRLTARLRLSADGAGSVELVDGDLEASVPLVGRRIEKAAEPAIRSAISVEGRTGQAWLAEHA